MIKPVQLSEELYFDEDEDPEFTMFLNYVSNEKGLLAQFRDTTEEGDSVEDSTEDSTIPDTDPFTSEY